MLFPCLSCSMAKHANNKGKDKAAPQGAAFSVTEGQLCEQPKNKGGRPPKYATTDEMEVAIEAYFAERETKEKPPTIAGLCVYLGFCEKQSFYDTEKRAGFSDLIKRTRLRLEDHHEARTSGTCPTGSIFWLKNHAGYQDKQEQDVNVNGSLSIEVTFRGADKG